ncbi:hypothetical protein LCGC14_1967170 [marine sediment metagenome]|uniref:Uncharacterized protein n=1 Tax=marine sediment metagenome TaxID=412755 RepID=A0A0F9I9T4_9ZZZZ
MKRIMLVALLVAALVGVPADSWATAPWGGAEPQSGESVYECWGVHGNLCVGTDAHGIGYIRFGNAYGGVYIFMDPAAQVDVADRADSQKGGAQTFGLADSHSVNLLKYAHSRNIETGLSDVQLRNMSIAFTVAHGRSMSIAHECTISGVSGTYTCP